MIEAVPKEGPRAPLFFAAVLLAGLPFLSGAAAQSVDVAALERCAQLETAELKLACYEALTADDTGTTAGVASATPADREPATMATAESASPPAASAAPDALDVADSPGSASGAEDGGSAATAAAAAALPSNTPEASAAPGAAAVSDPPASPEPAAAPGAAADAPRRGVADAPAPSPAVRTEAEPPPIPDELGAEQLAKPIDVPAGPTMATVIRVTRDYRNRLDFHLANGHVWRQIEPRRFRYPKDRAFDVVISRGLMGEYRLRVDGEGPMVRIRRVK